MSNLYWLTEEQMMRLRPYFPKSRGKPRVDDRRVVSGIIFINRNGLRWCDAPAAYGPPKTLYNRWKRPLSGMNCMPFRSPGAIWVFSLG
jgi:transposase